MGLCQLSDSEMISKRLEQNQRRGGYFAFCDSEFQKGVLAGSMEVCLSLFHRTKYDNIFCLMEWRSVVIDSDVGSRTIDLSTYKQNITETKRRRFEKTTTPQCL